jgi:hypothetical protein
MSVLEGGGYGLMHFSMTTALLPAFKPGNLPKITNQPAISQLVRLQPGQYFSGCNRAHFHATVEPFSSHTVGTRLEVNYLFLLVRRTRITRTHFTKSRALNLMRSSRAYST